MAIILTEAEAKALLQKALSYSKADECEVNLSGEERGNIRYARNEVSTSGSLINQNLAVQSAFGKKVGTATIDEFDDASLEKVVRRSEELARLAPENPEYAGMLGPQTYLKSNGFFDSTATITPDTRAEAVAKSLQLTRDARLVAAGFLEDRRGYQAMMNSKGLFAYYPSTNVNYTLTVRTNDGKGSGYVARGYSNVSKLDTAAATNIAIQKARGSAEARALEPGKYTVILEPTAAVVLLENVFFNMDARSADEGRSYFSKTGGKSRLGDKIVDERVTICSDPTNADLPAPSPGRATVGRRRRPYGLRKVLLRTCRIGGTGCRSRAKKPFPARTT